MVEPDTQEAVAAEASAEAEVDVKAEIILYSNQVTCS